MEDLLLILEARDAARTGRARRIREAAGVSQGEIGRRLHVHGATVSRWESASRRPSGEQAAAWALMLRQLAEHLGKPSADVARERIGGA